MIKALFSRDLLPALVKEIKLAEKSICVVMYDWHWYPGQHTGTCQDINRELSIQGRNGLDVRALLHNESMGRPLHKINRKAASHLKQNKVQVKWGNTGRPTHAKVWIFDQARVIIGSHNISVRAVRTNVECSVLCDVRDVVDVVVPWFEGLWAKGM